MLCTVLIDEYISSLSSEANKYIATLSDFSQLASSGYKSFLTVARFVQKPTCCCLKLVLRFNNNIGAEIGNLFYDTSYSQPVEYRIKINTDSSIIKVT